LILPAICLNRSLWKSFGNHITSGIYVLLLTLVVIGIASAYFHATLSLLGQMLDEVSIAWILCLSYSFLTPNHYRPHILSGIYGHLVAIIVATLLTFIWFIYPSLNAYGLFVVGTPCILMLRKEVFVRKLSVTHKLGTFCLYLALLSIGIWVVDRSMCGMLKYLKLPGIHNIWHINMAVTSYLAITVFGFWKAYYDEPSCNPTIKFWPSDDKGYGIPYVYCKKDNNSNKKNNFNKNG